MKPATRHICLMVLMGLLLGHTSIAVHAATHVGGDSGECELCFTYGDSADAVEITQAHGMPHSRGEHLADTPAPTPETRHVTPYRPRGPPLTD